MSGSYQGVESRRVRAIGNVVPIALSRGRVWATVNAQRGCGAQLVPCRGQQPALVHRAVHRRLTGRSYSRVRNGPASGLAARG